MTTQPDVTLTGVTVGSTIVATWAPKGFNRTIHRIRLNGPVPSQFDIYVGMVNDSCRIATTNRGDNNQGDFSNPLPIPAGHVVYFVWSGYTTATSATVTVGWERE